MIITKTPFRVSFLGGGTDFPLWYNKNGGMVISTTIDKYCYISCRILPPFFDYKYRFMYSQKEEVRNISEIKHPSIRECLKFLNIKDGLEIHHDADLPARSGLGASSSFTVGLLNALYRLSGESFLNKHKLANDAIHIEQNIIGESCGSQDQTIVSHGGFNVIVFTKDGIFVSPVDIDKKLLEELNKWVVIFFTGFTRFADKIEHDKLNRMQNKTDVYTKLRYITSEGLQCLKKGNITEFGKLVDESWNLKKCMSPSVTLPEIDIMYQTAKGVGSIGGKLLGSGGGGFFLFFIEPSKKEKLIDAFKNLLHVPFNFESNGTQVIYDSGERVNEN